VREHLVLDVVFRAELNAKLCDSGVVDGSSIDVSSNNRHPSINEVSDLLQRHR
jgi:hypothetical protein